MISKDSVMLKQWRNAQRLNINDIVKGVIKSNEKQILDIHRDQLRRGEFGDGKSPRYPDGYLSYKKTLPSYYGGGNTDLYVTGAFQNAEFIRVGSNVEIDSTDSKTVILLDKYGETIFDLNPNSMTMVHEVTDPATFKEVHKQLNA